MCKFFSLVSDGNGKPYYFDWELRKKVLSGELKNYEPDSHTSIADYFGFKNEKEDKLNKYEYNPFTKKFEVDQTNTKDDSEKIKEFCKKLDFKKVVELLRIQRIIHPFKIKPSKITDAEIALVKEWASVWDSVWASIRDSVGDSVKDSIWDSVWDSVRDSVGDSVRDSVWALVRASVMSSVWASIWDSVGDSVRDSIWDSVRDSIWDSVRDSVGDSVRASVWAYCSDFVDAKYKYDFSPTIKLWKKGLVPSFDGKLWRLHGGKDGKILWTESRQCVD